MAEKSLIVNIGASKQWPTKLIKIEKVIIVFLKTDSPSAAVQEMERLMRIHEDIMRVLTIKVDVHNEGPSIQISKREDRSDRRERSE